MELDALKFVKPHLKSLSFVIFVKIGKHIFDCVVRTSDGLLIAVMYSIDGKIFAAKIFLRIFPRNRLGIPMYKTLNVFYVYLVSRSRRGKFRFTTRGWENSNIPKQIRKYRWICGEGCYSLSKIVVSTHPQTMVVYIL